MNIVTKSDDGQFAFSGQIDLQGRESWDGLVVQQTLCVAAGTYGLLCFSLEEPDRPTENSEWQISRQLDDQVDVRQLISPDGKTVLLAAGAAGLLSGQMGRGQFQFDSAFKFQSPIYAVTAIDGVCLYVSSAQYARHWTGCRLR